jgi:competence protein ComEC
LIPAGALIEIMLAMVDLLKNIPGAYHWTGAREITMVLYYAALAAGLWGIGTNRCRAATAAGAGLALIMVSFYIPPGWNSHGQMKVVFIDVGQGDSILIKTPGGKFILIDGGGNQFYDVGRLKLLPYLHRCGINKLLMVVNTHPDIDHLGGLEPVLASTSVKYLAVPAGLDQAPEYSRLKKSKAEKFVPLKAGQIIKLEDNCFIKVLLPVNQTYALNNFNNQSLVLLLEYGQFRLLLTGDIETEAINHLLVSPPGPCTVVKIPHHGSRNSLSEPLYDITRPVYAVITAGRNNSFGHPHIEVTNTLESKGINILRTDRNGAITMTTDGQHLKVQNTLKGD